MAGRSPSYTVLLGARSRANGEEAVQQLRSQGLSNVQLQVIDIDSEASVTAAVEEVRSKHGALHYLLNNAGILFGEENPANAAAVIYTNYTRTRAVTEAFLPIMPEDGSARVVMVSSMVGTWVHNKLPPATRTLLDSDALKASDIDELAAQWVEGASPPHAHRERFAPAKDGGFYGASYGVSKDLLSCYGRMLAREQAAHKRAVFIACPGFCQTPMTATAKGATRTATQGAESILAPLEAPLEQQGSILQDGKEIPFAQPKRQH